MNLRAAVIGAGFVGRAHIEALRRLAIPIQAVLRSSLARTQEACRSLGIARAYESMDELAKDGSVDVVHVCTPNHFHFQQSGIRSARRKACDVREAAGDEPARNRCAGTVGRKARKSGSRDL